MPSLSYQAKMIVTNLREESLDKIRHEIIAQTGQKYSRETIRKYRIKLPSPTMDKIDKKMDEIDIHPSIPTKITPTKQKIVSYEELKNRLEQTLSFENLDQVVMSRVGAAAEALFVKFNPKGEVEDYNRRNKNHYIIAAKAALDIAIELLLENREELLKR
ncbi:MAG: hypothetical protein ACFE9L_09265 [Candidatus Hodarchaeota archaeon]